MGRYKNGRSVYKNRQERTIVACLNCQEPILALQTRNRKYCSNKCQGQHDVISKLKEDTYFSAACRHYIKNVYFINQGCANCGQKREWKGKPLTLQIDHINGNTRDNRVENLRLLCPNCHTQTETWGKPKNNIRPCSSAEERSPVTREVGVS